jgi:protein-tyrosine phosphatase
MVRIGVLFVCLGNICRSPLAEGVFRKLVRDAGLHDRFRVDSAGTSGYHQGDAPDPRTCAAAERRGVVLEHTARRVRATDLQEFDYVLAMDTENLERIQALRDGTSSRARVALLRSFEPGAPPGAEVPDPYYGGERGFDDVHDMVERACRGLLSHICAERSLPC